MTVRILTGDARDVLATIDAGSVQCCVTSPPYFGLRAYLPDGHPDKALEIGTEQAPDAYVAEMVAVFREVRRVLRDDGTLWLNIGDCYAQGGGGGASSKSTLKNDGRPVYGARAREERLNEVAFTRKAPAGYKPKDLLGIPWLVAFALRADGWWLRSAIVWAKPNPMPESVQGSHFSRHMVTMAEYERLSGLPYSEQRPGEDWAGDMPSLSEAELSGDKAPVSAKREGAGDSARSGKSAGCNGKASTVRKVGAGAEESGELRSNAEGQGHQTDLEQAISSYHEGQGQREEACGQSARSNPASGRRGDGTGLDRHSGAPQAPLLLLSEADIKDDAGSRDSAEQGRAELAGERGSSMSLVQQHEEGPDLPSRLVPCPGCEKCNRHHGYTFHLSAGRPTSAYEMVFMLSKRSTYFYDADSVREEAVEAEHHARYAEAAIGYAKKQPGQRDTGMLGCHPNGRNLRNVWTIATQPYSGAHFATMPPDLAARCVKAGTSERGQCPHCGAPWARTSERTDIPDERAKGSRFDAGKTGTRDGGDRTKPGERFLKAVTGWQSTCTCPEHTPIPQTVLDPFAGAGTTLLVADRLRRNAVGIELNPAYAKLARDRIQGDAPLFAEVAD